MTAQELLDKLCELSAEELELEVMFAYPSGDYWRTELANTPHKVQVEGVKFSDYHSRHATMTEEQEDEARANDEHFTEVIILR